MQDTFVIARTNMDDVVNVVAMKVDVLDGEAPVVDVELENVAVDDLV